MAESEEEYIEELGKMISDCALNSNWVCCTSNGELEDLSSDVSLLKNTVGLLCAIIVNHRIISLEQLKSLMENGFRINEVKP